MLIGWDPDTSLRSPLGSCKTKEIKQLLDSFMHDCGTHFMYLKSANAVAFQFQQRIKKTT